MSLGLGRVHSSKLPQACPEFRETNRVDHGTDGFKATPRFLGATFLGAYVLSGTATHVPEVSHYSALSFSFRTACNPSLHS